MIHRPLAPLRGVLESHDDTAWTAVLREVGTGDAVTLGGGPGLAPMLRGLLGREIEVWGRDIVTPVGPVLMIYGLDTVPPWQPPAGMSRSWNNGIDVTEWVRAQRI